MVSLINFGFPKVDSISIRPSLVASLAIKIAATKAAIYNIKMHVSFGLWAILMNEEAKCDAIALIAAILRCLLCRASS